MGKTETFLKYFAFFITSLTVILGMQAQLSLFSRKGFRLEGRTIKSFHVSSLTECGQWCLRDSGCLSMNYGLANSDSQMSICELNNSTRGGLKHDTNFAYYEAIERKPKEPVKSKSISKNATSCSYYMAHGAPGVYTIYNTAGNKTYNVHCHFDQKNQKSWTMVTSFAFSNNQHLSSSPFWVDKPYNEEAPNFKLYRMSLKRMMKVRKLATEWRSICAYNGKMSDRLDSVRGEFKNLDPLKNVTIGSCKRVKYVNIRGTTCVDCTAKVFQTETQFFHIDSDKTCTLPFPPDASTISEDNFGYYRNVNPNFTCTSDGESTTSWWFGN